MLKARLHAPVAAAGPAGRASASERAATGPAASPRVATQRAQLDAMFGPIVARARHRSADHPVQREDGFTFGGGTVEQQVIEDQQTLTAEVESLIDERFGGIRNLFTKNEVMNSPAQWRDLIHSYMEDNYVLRGIGREEILQAVTAVKAKYREETLLDMAKVHVYWSDEGPPYSADNLADRLVDAGAYIERDDMPVVQAIYATDGEFARTKVEVAPGNKELSDAGKIVVLMDDHQNKHQRDKILGFKPYTGEPGTKFAAGKDLNWHVENTVPVVRDTIQQAIDSEHVTTDGERYSPSKDAIDGIIYDLTISYDDKTGKYVGVYHCNPVEEE